MQIQRYWWALLYLSAALDRIFLAVKMKPYWTDKGCPKAGPYSGNVCVSQPGAQVMSAMQVLSPPHPPTGQGAAVLQDLCCSLTRSWCLQPVPITWGRNGGKEILSPWSNLLFPWCLLKHLIFLYVTCNAWHCFEFVSSQQMKEPFFNNNSLSASPSLRSPHTANQADLGLCFGLQVLQNQASSLILCFAPLLAFSVIF